MNPKKVVYLLFKILSVMLIFSVLFLPLEVLAKGYLQPKPSIETNSKHPEEIIIKIHAETIINDNFYGFGVETLPCLWTKENKKAGVGEEDIRLNLKRIKEMNFPITRIFVPWEIWNPSVDYKTFTWKSDGMESLCKTLDLCQEMNTKVILVTIDWLGDSPWKNVIKSARAVLSLLEYLIKAKGYSCIKFWTLTNEPELTYGWLKKLSFEKYVQIHRLVKRGFKERGLPVKIIVSDEVESKEWFEKSVQSLYNVADIFSSHAYFFPQQVHLIPVFFKERLGIIKEASLTKKHTTHIPAFFLCEFGFRGSDFGALTNSFMREYKYGLLTSELAIEVLNQGVDCASFWCLHEIYLLDGRKMQIGLWGYKDEDWYPRPVFYAYALFTKYIKSEAKIIKTESSCPSAVKAACASWQDNFSLFVLNITSLPQNIQIFGFKPLGIVKRYIYSEDMIPTYKQAIVESDKTIEIIGHFKDEIPPNSLVLYSNF
ncbi:MAG: hypothetical protein ISS47_01250 [Candidatus Omnitrophica bacterium]|nr:hypothetical protein [Candidatus Omnitrophota bacterium]